jgi:hypothetical protein
LPGRHKDPREDFFDDFSSTLVLVLSCQALLVDGRSVLTSLASALLPWPPGRTALCSCICLHCPRFLTGSLPW